MKTINITVTESDVSDALYKLSINSKYLSIADNLFDIHRITTMLKPDIDMNHYSFSLSYNDPNMKAVIQIYFKFEDMSCLSFLHVSKLINDEQIAEIANKIHTIEFDEDETAIAEKVNAKIDVMVFNEALMLMMNGINKDDCESVKNDLTSKYENWKAKIGDANKVGYELMTKLYDKLYQLKLSENI